MMKLLAAAAVAALVASPALARPHHYAPRTQVEVAPSYDWYGAAGPGYGYSGSSGYYESHYGGGFGGIPLGGGTATSPGGIP
jgi:opacity protein-like surface antigen